MDTGLYALVSGSMAQEVNLEILAHNLANVNTIAFKEERPLFDLYVSDAVRADASPEAAQSAVWNDRATIVRFSRMLIDFSQGALMQTGNAFDLALQGEGFFSVQTPKGVQYTRGGNFRLNEQGQIVTQEGFPLLSDSGPVAVNGSKISVDRDGRLRVDGEERAKLALVSLNQPNQAAKSSYGFYLPASQRATQKAKGITVHQGYLERSNVNAIQGMVRLIEYQRAYETYQKSIQQILGNNGITSGTVNEVGKVG